jgi:hypothetical protein
VFTEYSITKLPSPLSVTCATVYALLVPPNDTMRLPSCTRQDNKVVPRGFGVSLTGTPLLAEASLRSRQLRKHGT